MKRFYLLIFLMLMGFVGRAPAADVLNVKSGDIFLNMGNKNGVSFGTIFNVYRNKEVEAEFGNLKLTTRIFIGRVYAYKVAKTQTVARIKELPSVSNAENKAVLMGDVAQPAFILSADNLFKVGDNNVLATGVSKLERLLRFVKRFKALKIRVESHCDNGVENATKATRAQARSIRDWLVKKGKIDEKLFVPIGYGDQKPLVSNATEEGQQRNRRIEVIVED